MPDASPELSVVCRNCGSEVSPYVTECPYCGTRLRKRAPKLERRGDELRARESLRARRKRKLTEKRLARQIDGWSAPRPFAAADRAYVTIAMILAPALLLVVTRAADLTDIQVGLLGPPGLHGDLALLHGPLRLRQRRLPVCHAASRSRSSCPLSSGAWACPQRRCS